MDGKISTKLFTPAADAMGLVLLRSVSIAALLVARSQRLTLRHAQQESNEVRDDRALSYLRAMGVEHLSTFWPSTRANEGVIIEIRLYGDPNTAFVT